MRLTRRGDVADRLLARVEKCEQTGCWNWTGTKGPKGYGSICGPINGVRHAPVGQAMLAHRASWILANGAIPDGGPKPHGWVVMHKCDNPLCVNPAHLMLGTQRENIKDMEAKGRAKRKGVKGSAHHQAKFTEEQVAAIKRDPRGHTEVAKEYGTSAQLVHYIRHKGWSGVEGKAAYDTSAGKSRAGASNASAKLNDDIVRAIRASTEKPGALAKLYGIGADYVTSIRKRKAWQHVE